MLACTAFNLIFISFSLTLSSKIRKNPLLWYIIRVMIHQPASSFYEGQTVECMLEANELLKMRKTMTKIYAQRTGKPSWQISKDMERDLYMSAEEAQAHGIIDMVADSL